MSPQEQAAPSMHTQNPRSAGSEEAAMRQIALAFDIKRLNASFLDNPFPVYRALREHDPVHRMPDGSYFLSRYEDCAAVYRDPETWSSDKKIDFRPSLGESSLYEAPHHQPCVQRSAISQPSPQALGAGVYPASAEGLAAPDRGARGPFARSRR